MDSCDGWSCPGMGYYCPLGKPGSHSTGNKWGYICCYDAEKQKLYQTPGTRCNNCNANPNGYYTPASWEGNPNGQWSSSWLYNMNYDWIVKGACSGGEDGNDCCYGPLRNCSIGVQDC